MEQAELQRVLNQHKAWLNEQLGYSYRIPDGTEAKQANLERADLRGVDLQSARLQYARMQGANLQGANLQGTNLRKARLQGASLQDVNMWRVDLRDANIRDCFGNGAEVKSLHKLDGYSVVWTQQQLAVGCEQHSKEEWLAFSDKQIAAMSDNALSWWHKHKQTLLSLGAL